MWVMCVYEQCMSMCTCTRIDAPSPWWQGAAPTWTLEVLKLQWHPQIRWIFMIFLTKLEQIGKGTDTGLIPVYPHAAHALLILLVLLPQLPVALSLAFSRWAEKKSDFFFGQTGHATILLRFLQYFSVIFHQESLIPLSFWPMIRKIQVSSALGMPLLLSCLVLLPAHLVQANGRLILVGVVMIIQWTNIQNSWWLHGCFRAFMGVFSLFTHAESCWSILDISGYLKKVCPRPGQIRLTLPGCFKYTGTMRISAWYDHAKKNGRVNYYILSGKLT